MRRRLALFSMDDGEYQEALREDCVQAAGRHGYGVRVFNADGDSQKQVRQIQTVISEPPEQRPAAILICPVREVSLLSVAHATARRGIGCVFLLRRTDYLEDLRQEFPHVPIFAVLCDQQEIGRIQGWQVRALLPRGGELLYIRGPLGTSSATLRFEGLHDVLKDSSVQVFTLNSDWTFDGGAREMAEWTRIFDKRQLPRCVVGAQNDAMAMGARSALEQIAKDSPSFRTESIPFCGCDGSPDFGQRLVKEGKLTATVVMPVCASRAVAEIDSTLNGGPQPHPAIVLKPMAFPEAQFLRGADVDFPPSATMTWPAPGGETGRRGK